VRVVDQLSVVSAIVFGVTVSDLVLNPHLLIQPIAVNGRVAAYSLVAPVKGRGRLQNTIKVSDADEHVIHVLKGLVSASTDVEVSASAFRLLADIGVLLREDEISRCVKFSCHFGGDNELAPTSLALNVDFACFPFADFVERKRELARVLEPCAQILLVADPVSGARYPYWIDDREYALLKRLQFGAVFPTDLDSADVRHLIHANILVNRRAVATARRRLSAAVAQFARYGYAELPQLLPSLQFAALRSYYQNLLDEGHVPNRDDQVQFRFALHNEPLMQYYHRQLCSLFSRIAGKPIKPSYGYLASYRRGAMLKKHRDREQCEFTASLLLDYVAMPTDDLGWPLYLELPGIKKQITIEQTPGDCVLFSGCTQPHYRREFRGERSTSLFFHYVDKEFSGSLL
jgi:hypothetical protein